MTVKEKEALEKAIRDRPQDKALYARLSNILIKLRKFVPSEIERRSLEYYLEKSPKRTDLRRRLCFLRLQEREHQTEKDIEHAFPEYIGEGGMYSFLAPLYQPAYEEGDAEHLDLPTRVLHERFPDCPCCLHFRASWLFHFGDPENALEMLERAKNLVTERDYLALLYINLLNYEGRPAGNPSLRVKARNFIVDFFNTYKGDMWRESGFRKRQAEAINHGIPPVLIVTLPKSGSVFLLNTLSRGLRIPYTYLCPLGLYYDVVIERRVRDFIEGGAISVDHIEATNNNIDDLYKFGVRKIIFHYRDIRQSILSFVHHSASDEMVTRPRKSVLAYRERINNSREFEQSYRDLFGRRLPFLDKWADCIATDTRFEFLVTNFDDLQDEAGLIRRILDFYEIPHDKFDWSILNTDKKERAGHFRKGLKDEWRQVLSPELQAEIEQKLEESQVLSRLEAFR